MNTAIAISCHLPLLGCAVTVPVLCHMLSHVVFGDGGRRGIPEWSSCVFRARPEHTGLDLFCLLSDQSLVVMVWKSGGLPSVFCQVPSSVLTNSLP